MLVHGGRRRARGRVAHGNSLARRGQGRVCRERRREAEHYVGAVGGSEDRRGEGVHLPGATIHHAAAGEIRTMDCVDCHNRPSHILQAPDRSVDVALADGRIDPSLPFIKQQGVAALTATYAGREQAMQGIDNSLRGYYQKTYPQIYSGKQQAIEAPSRTCKHLRPLFLPGDESPVGHIFHQRHAFLFGRVLPLPRRPA
jgi:hypothetical protein